jgi:hypothetical protein
MEQVSMETPAAIVVRDDATFMVSRLLFDINQNMWFWLSDLPLPIQRPHTLPLRVLKVTLHQALDAYCLAHYLHRGTNLNIP